METSYAEYRCLLRLPLLNLGSIRASRSRSGQKPNTLIPVDIEVQT